MALVKEFEVDKLKVEIFDTRKAMGEMAANNVAQKIKELLKEMDEINIIFAAAPSQDEFFDSLIAHHEIEWGKINAFHMDEYVGVDTNQKISLASYMREKLSDRVSLKSMNFMNGKAENIEAECERYSELLRKFSPDIVCMGIGDNGHLAFNDPHVASFNDEKLVKVVDIDNTSKTQQFNTTGCFDKIEDIPSLALTITIPALMSGKYVSCVVPTKAKAEALFKALNGVISEECPASILRTHENAILYADLDSSSCLRK